MKRLFWLFSFASTLLIAQDGVEKATIPLTNPARPVQMRVNMMNGGITVKGYDGKDVLVESHSRGGGSRRQSAERSDGMKRLDLGSGSGLNVEEEDNVVTIKTEAWNNASDLVISTPRHTSLRLKCMNNGAIEVEGVDGEIDADNLNGKVVLRNVSGSVVAHSLNGEVVVSMDRVDGGKPMSFSTMNGTIDVTLPPTVKANVRMKTDHGEILSDFDVKMDPASGSIRNEPGRENGKYRVKFDRSIRGSINGGGPEYQFTSFNGQILIRKKK